MNDLRQREQLLKESRRIYRQNSIPAVHPRYHSTCSFMYKDTQKHSSHSTGLRIFISLLLFVLFGVCDLRQIEVGNLNTSSFIEELQKCPYDNLISFSFPHI